MLIPKAFADFLRSEGRPLSEINPGSRETGLRPESALRAIELLSGSQVAVLGGDVLKDESGKLSYTYANWYCERRPNEDPLGFSDRSRSTAREYISRLLRRSDENLYVVLVVSELGMV